MRGSQRLPLAAASGLAAAAFLAAAPAQASFHFMKLVEVFPGTEAEPAAQYVVLQMYSPGQNLVDGHGVVVFDAAGSQLAEFVFEGDVANGANQAKILVATPEAAALFDLGADLEMSPSLPLAGGKVCFDQIDCVAWGSYAPTDASVGTPFNGGEGTPWPGLRRNRAIARRLDVNGIPGLQANDDTGQSANDWVFAAPAPRNNAGQLGTPPASFCSDGVTGGLEDCDDANLESGDGCTDSCRLEYCGDLVVNDVDEECDDGNVTSGDGCEADCTLPEPANGLLAGLVALALLQRLRGSQPSSRDRPGAARRR